MKKPPKRRQECGLPQLGLSQRAAVTYWRLAHRTPRKFPTGGGDADVEEEAYQGIMDSALGPADDGAFNHKSVLTAR